MVRGSDITRTAVVDLDPEDAVRGVQGEVEGEAPAGRYAVEDGVRGEFAHAELDVVGAVGPGPGSEGRVGELAGQADVSAVAEVEAGFDVHEMIVTVGH
jgi:hypothetical protein